MEKEKLDMLINEEGVKALETLIEVAVKLKDSGLLDTLNFIAERSGELLTIISNDVPLQRATALGDAGLRALGKLEPQEVVNIKFNMEELTTCAFKALSNLKLEELKPVGITGLLKAGNDKDLQLGLAMMMALGKAMGKCLREKVEK